MYEYTAVSLLANDSIWTNIYLPINSGVILLLTAAHGRSVLSKHRHHSCGATDWSRSVSHCSKNGFMHTSLWSCSKSYNSCSDRRPSESKSKCWNIHRTSPLHTTGKWAVTNDTIVITFTNRTGWCNAQDNLWIWHADVFSLCRPSRQRTNPTVCYPWSAMQLVYICLTVAWWPCDYRPRSCHAV